MRPWIGVLVYNTVSWEGTRGYGMLLFGLWHIYTNCTMSHAA